MQFKLFGFTIVKDNKEKQKQDAIKSFVEPDVDGSVEIDVIGGGFNGGAIASSLETEEVIRRTSDLVHRYRDMARHPEADWAIDDIVNEAITSSKTQDLVTIDLDHIDDLSDNVKDKIREEFSSVLNLMNYTRDAFDLFRSFYIDGRLAYHKIIDPKRPKDGIIEIRQMDSAAVSKIVEVERTIDDETHTEIIKKTAEYFVYNKMYSATGGSNIFHQTIRINPDAVAYVHSGIYSPDRKLVEGWLHKAIKPLNQLRMVEDSAVIYRVTRAPERRVFYIDVGRLPTSRAQQVVQQAMNDHRNYLQYNATTGEIMDNKKHMHMLEDFFIPRREGSRGTEITTLEGGQNLGEMDDVLYFQKNFLRSLNIPLSRIDPESGFQLGRVAEISRDEVKFSKFIDRILKRFSGIFDDLLGTQLVLKGIMRKDEWDSIKNNVFYDFLKDSYFQELKEMEVFRDRISLLESADNFVGKYFSKEQLFKDVLWYDDEKIKEVQKQIAKESKDPNAYAPTDMQLAQGMLPPDQVLDGSATGAAEYDIMQQQVDQDYELQKKQIEDTENDEE